MSKQYKKIIHMTSWIVIVLFFFRCLISYNSLINDFSFYAIISYAGEVIGITVIIVGLYVKWVWRYLPFKGTPILGKHYNGIIRSSSGDREARLIINQTLLSIHITLISKESKSKSISSTIEDNCGERQLIYCYINTPQAAVRYKSQIHYGTAILCVDDPQMLTGQYFSDRQTSGDMIFSPKKELKKTKKELKKTKKAS